MAKKVSFGDKVRGKKDETKDVHIKLVRSRISKRTGGLKFSEEVIGVSPEENLDKYVEALLKQ